MLYIQLPSEDNNGDDDLGDFLGINENAAPVQSSFEPAIRSNLPFRSQRRRHTGRSDASSCGSGSVYAYGSGIGSGVSTINCI